MAGELNQPWQNQTNQNQWWSGQQQGATGGNMYGQPAVQQPARTQPPTSGYGSFSVPTQQAQQPQQPVTPATPQPPDRSGWADNAVFNDPSVQLPAGIAPGTPHVTFYADGYGPQPTPQTTQQASGQAPNPGGGTQMMPNMRTMYIQSGHLQDAQNKYNNLLARQGPSGRFSGTPQEIAQLNKGLAEAQRKIGVWQGPMESMMSAYNEYDWGEGVNPQQQLQDYFMQMGGAPQTWYDTGRQNPGEERYNMLNALLGGG